MIGRDPGAFEDAVCRVVAHIPEGTVVTYGEIAAEAGYPGAARAVGNVLQTSQGLPWWRVVTVAGRLVPGLEHCHAEHLRAEGIVIREGSVVAPERDRR